MITKNLLKKKKASLCSSGKIQHETERNARNHVIGLILSGFPNAFEYRCEKCGMLHVSSGKRRSHATYQVDYRRNELKKNL